MTEAIRKFLPPEYLAILTLLGSVFGYIHSIGFNEAEREAMRRDITRQDQTIARLERAIRYLDLRVRKAESWPSRAGGMSTQTDHQ